MDIRGNPSRLVLKDSARTSLKEVLRGINLLLDKEDLHSVESN